MGPRSVLETRVTVPGAFTLFFHFLFLRSWAGETAGQLGEYAGRGPKFRSQHLVHSHLRLQLQGTPMTLASTGTSLKCTHTHTLKELSFVYVSRPLLYLGLLLDQHSSVLRTWLCQGSLDNSRSPGAIPSPDRKLLWSP